MRWYHWITTYMIILGALGLTAIGADLGPWYMITCLCMMGVGTVGTIFLPGDKEDEVRRAP